MLHVHNLLYGFLVLPLENDTHTGIHSKSDSDKVTANITCIALCESYNGQKFNKRSCMNNGKSFMRESKDAADMCGFDCGG